MLVNSTGLGSGDPGFTFQLIAYHNVIVDKLFPMNLSFLA